MRSKASGTDAVTAKLAVRSPFGAMEHMVHEALVTAQRESAAAPRRRYSLSARALFAVMDLLYGKERTLPKFRVLELVARVPYSEARMGLHGSADHGGHSAPDRGPLGKIRLRSFPMLPTASANSRQL